MGKPQSLDPEILYRIGHAHFRMANNTAALHFIRMAIAQRDNVPKWHYRLGFILEREGRYAEARERYEKAIALAPNELAWKKRIDNCQQHINQIPPSKHGKTYKLDETNKLEETYKRAAQLKKQALYYSAIDTLRTALSDNPNVGGLLKRLAEVYEVVQEYGLSAHYYERANMEDQNPELAFLAAYSYERAGQAEKAATLYELASQLEGHEGRQFGAGVFFQRRGLWHEAMQQYRSKAEKVTHSAELLFRLGMCHDRLYEWNSAERYYREALALEPDHPYRYYRLGFVCERGGKYALAIQAYSIAVASKHKDSPFWSYRLGYCLTVQARFEDACRAFIFSESKLFDKLAVRDELTVEPADGNVLLESRLSGISAERREVEAEAVGAIALSLREYRIAAMAFSMLVDAAPRHSKINFFRLGYAEYKQGNIRAAALAFSEMRLHQHTHGVNASSYDKDKGLSEVMSYAELSDFIPIRENTVLYESGHGSSINCNPFAIFENLIHQTDRDLWHVWVCKDPQRVPEAVRRHRRVIIVQKDTYQYRRHLASAKFLINNTSFPPYFVRRDGQKYLNTWHGTPLKTLGKDVKVGFFEHRNITRNLLQATHLIVPNEHTGRVLINSHEIEGLFTGKVALTGYPRVDKSLDITPARIESLRIQLGIEPGDDRPIVLYAPTWRGGLGTSHFDTDQLEKDLNSLQRFDRHVFFRAHRFAEDVIERSKVEARVVPANIDTNDLLSVVDTLVTDYSSIFFDYLPLRRPVIFYVPDLEEYQEQRGLYFQMENMPGALCRDLESLAAAVDEALLGGKTSDHTLALSEFCPMDDGFAAARAIEFFFDESDKHVIERPDNNKSTILFRQSFIPNGITSSFINLLNSLDKNRYRIVILFDANSIANNQDRIKLFEKLPKHVQRIARSGRQLFLAEERWLESKFSTQGHLHNTEQMNGVALSAQREFRRLFGSAEFDHLCEFDGYSRFWASIFAHGGENIKSRLIYMHNELEPEHRIKHPDLNGVFHLYPFFDRLISVSESVMVANRKAFADSLGLPSRKFTFANNMIDPDAVKSASMQPVPFSLEDWIGRDSYLIVTMGRLSPEKGHERLIRAFSLIAKRSPEAKLVIVGEGALRPILENLITDLGLEDRVLLLGMLANPFPVLALADGFILPSMHEGQGLALVEAMLLGKPVVATDIPGPRSLLSDGKGNLVKNNEQGVLEGLLMLTEGSVEVVPFEPAIYKQNAMDAFLSNLG